MARKRTRPALAANDKVGERLRATREALGLNPIDVCRDLGFAQNTYSQWESGDRRPNLDDMISFAENYGVPLDWIYRGVPSGLPRDLASKILREIRTA